MTVNIDCYDVVYVVEFEPFMGEDIEKYYSAFQNWFFELVDVPEISVKVRKMKSTLPYDKLDYKPFVDWLNFTCSTCNARLIQTCESGTENKENANIIF